METLKDLFVDPFQQTEFWTAMERQRQIRDHEVKLKKRDGCPITVPANAYAKKDRSGTALIGYHLTVVDVTESRRLMQQLYQSDKLAVNGPMMYLNSTLNLPALRLTLFSKLRRPYPRFFQRDSDRKNSFGAVGDRANSLFSLIPEKFLLTLVMLFILLINIMSQRQVYH